MTWQIIALAQPTNLPVDASLITKGMLGCTFPQELFVTAPGASVTTGPALKPRDLSWPPIAGHWYMDVEGVGHHSADTVYVTEDPTAPGTTVELTGPTQAAFDVRQSGVTMENLTIEKFSPQNQKGAIAVIGNVSNTVVNANWVTHNHGACYSEVNGPSHSQIRYNSLEACGQNAYDGGGPTSPAFTTFSYNDIGWNNEDNVGTGWDAGGLKWANAVAFDIEHNTSHDNNGNGLWCDSYCGRDTASGTTNRIIANTVTDNGYDGIRYEISHFGTIQSNILTNNSERHPSQCVAAHDPELLGGLDCCTGPGTGPSCTGCNKPYSEIALGLDDNMEVNGNTITSNCAGIMASGGQRAGVTYTPNTNIHITHNSLTLHTASQRLNQVHGGSNVSPGVLYDSTSNNLYDYNVYHFPDDNGAGLSLKHFQWCGVTPCVDGTYTNGQYTFSDWQNLHHQDVHGCADNGSGCP